MKYILIITLLFTILGLIGNFIKINKIKLIIKDIFNYKEDFKKFNSNFKKRGKINNILFDNITKQSSIISKLAYDYIFLDIFISKASGYTYKNYNMIANFIPNYKTYDLNNKFHLVEESQISNLLDIQLNICIGDYRDKINDLKKRILNPYLLLKDGYKLLILELNLVLKIKKLETNLDYLSNILSIISSTLAILVILKILS